jgi:hypothetical protein
MKEYAVHDFIFLTDLSFDYGLIDRTVYIERMVSLYEMTDVDPDFIKHIVPPYGQRFYDNLIENNQNGENDQSSYEGEFGVIMQIPVKLTTQCRFKLTMCCRFKLTT